MPFFAIFIGIPFIEIMLFMSIGDSIGFMNTLLIAFSTAIIGGGIVRYQGMETLLQIKSGLNQGSLPLNELFDGICLVAAGALLITPGFLTDTIGFALLIPPVRAGLRAIIKRHTSWIETNNGYANESARRRHKRKAMILSTSNSKKSPRKNKRSRA